VRDRERLFTLIVKGINKINQSRKILMGLNANGEGIKQKTPFGYQITNERVLKNLMKMLFNGKTF